MDSVTEIIEQPLELRDGDRVVTFGTPDYVAYHAGADAVVVVDHKFGRGGVTQDAGTLQLMLLLAMALQKTGAARGDGYIHCVRTGERAHAHLTCEQIPEVIAMVDQSRAAGECPDAPQVPGEHCHYCRALGLCDATQEVAERAIVEAGVSEPTTAAEVKASIKQWPAERLLRGLKEQKLLEWICEARRSRAHEILRQDPDALPGWERWTKNGRRSCKGGPVALLECVDDVLTPADVLSESKVSVSAIERRYVAALTNDNVERGAKKKARERFAERTADVVSQGTEYHLRRRKEAQ